MDVRPGWSRAVAAASFASATAVEAAHAEEPELLGPSSDPGGSSDPEGSSGGIASLLRCVDESTLRCFEEGTLRCVDEDA